MDNPDLISDLKQLFNVKVEQSVSCITKSLGVPRWPTEKESKLRQMWIDGDSASIIGNELGCTRAAVIGKAHRLNLGPHTTTNTSRRSRLPRKPRKARNTRSERSPFWAANTRREISNPIAPAPKLVMEIPPLRINMMQLTSTTCRWPVGDAPSWDYCGHDVMVGQVYCGFHCLVAYEPERTRKSREKAPLFENAQ